MNKHYFLLVLSLLSSIYLLGQQVCPGNLLSNPSFEQGITTPGQHVIAANWTGGHATYPSNYAQWNNLNGNAVGYLAQSGATMSQIITAVPGQNYTLSFNVGMYHPSINSGIVQLEFLDNTNATIGLPSTLNITHDLNAIPSILFVGATQTLNLANAPVNAASVKVSITYTNNNASLVDTVFIDGICLTSSPACNNVLDGGQIGTNEVSCGVGFQPATIQNIQFPSGGMGTIEYVWLQSTDAGVTFSIIPNSNNENYTPPFLTQSTWYRRCARRQGCAAYIGESNWVMKKVTTLPSVDAGNTLYLGCGNLSGVLNASYGANMANLHWSPSTGLSSSVLSQPFAFPSTTTTYTLTVTDFDNCVNSDTVTVFVNNTNLAKPSLSSFSTFPTCAGNTVILTANGIAGATFNWTLPAGCNAIPNNSISGQSTLTINNLSSSCAGTFSVSQTSNGCTSQNETLIVSTYDSLHTSILTTSEVCAGQSNGSIQTLVTGGSGNYVITNSALQNCPGCPCTNLQWLSPGTYTVTVTDIGCNGTTQTYTTTINPGAIVPTPVVANVITACVGEPLQLIGNINTPATTINWTKGSSLFNAIGNPSIIQLATLSLNGKYIAKALDQNGCASAPIEFDVLISDKPILDSIEIQCGGNTTNAIIHANLSTGSLLYSWDGNTYTSQNTFSNITPGNYTLHLKANNSSCETIVPVSIPNCNCVNSPTVTILAPKVSCSNTAIPIEATFTNVNQASISSTGTGSFSVNMSTSPLQTTYLPSAFDIANGHVTITVTTDDPDGAGQCTAITKSITIYLKDSLSKPNIVSNSTSYCQGDTVILSAQQPFIQWNTPSMVNIVSDSLRIVSTTNLDNGQYIAYAIGNGCTTQSDTFSLLVNNPPFLNVNLNLTHEQCAGNANGGVEVAISGGTGLYNACYIKYANCELAHTSPIEFKWLSPGNYTMYVSDASCPNAWTTYNYTLHPGKIVAPPTSANYNIGLCEGDSLLLHATGLPGEYIWTNTIDNCVLYGMNVYRPNANPAMNGAYKVHRVENGCSSESLYVDVYTYEQPQVVAIDTQCTGANEGTLSVNTIPTQHDTLEYAINNGAFQTSNLFTELSNGLYDVHVRTKGSNCITTINNVELSCTSLKEINLSVFPNPNNGSFTLNAILPQTYDDAIINVFDMNGKLIYEAIASTEFNILNHTINISSYAKGAYMLRVLLDGERYILPILVNE
jgi:hypothetical protein